MKRINTPSLTLEQRQALESGFKTNTIQNCIKLNEQLIQALEETAQAVYKKWFVEEADEIWEKQK
jgi:hypothetical protein